MTNSPKIRVIAGKAVSEYPSSAQLKDALRHQYHQHGEIFLQSLLEELPREVLILVSLRAEQVVQDIETIERPPAGLTKCAQ